MGWLDARCRCGVVSLALPDFPTFKRDVLLAPSCTCAMHAGTGGPPFLVIAAFPLQKLNFKCGFEFAGANLARHKRSLRLNGKEMCLACGDTIVIEPGSHVYRATFALLNKPSRPSLAEIELHLWVATGKRHMPGGGDPCGNIRTQAELDAHRGIKHL